MPKWTPEQQEAIDREGNNIIVSAGAGSGKTAVLSERVIRKLLNGVNIDHLLLLTFTKAAAFEMKMRIRDKIKKYPELKEQLNRIDSSYITTFDSFSLSLVKKYHYLLNISHDVKIIDGTIIKLEKIKRLNQIFDEYYEKEDTPFLSFIERNTLKDDQEMKDLILKMNDKLDLKYKKIEYLLNYISKNYKEEVLQKELHEFEDYLESKIKQIGELLQDISLEVEGDYYEKLRLFLDNLLNAKNYDGISRSLEIKLPNLPKGSSDEVKKQKEALSLTIKELKSLCIYSSSEAILEGMKETKNDVQVIIDIILKLDQEIYDFKVEQDSYEFVDISKMAINLVKNYPDIKKELQEYFNEIMIDEYQDTSDLQETFIGEIANHNVYMVGDIKQSIYRFRNANPYIFKNKYDHYKENDGGIKIDLNKNFRSREEVLKNINYIFDSIMDDAFGGADYKNGHQMVFGNMGYNEHKKEEQNSNFEIYNYQVEKGSPYSKQEIEIFTIIQDIKEKMEDNYQVVDKETFTLRDIKYSDFAILLDRATSFDLYKKIFEYFNMPLMVYKNTSITNEDDLYIMNNILKLIRSVKNKKMDSEFTRNFLSVGRSYLFSYDDHFLFQVVKNKSYSETSLYQIILKLAKDFDSLNAKSLLYRIIDDFQFYQRQLLVGGSEKEMARASYLLDMMESMTELSYSLDEIIDNFNKMVDEQEKIECSFSVDASDAVKLMTIHKSKGLEFSICYFAGFSNKFNISDMKEKMIFDNQYGFILPIMDTVQVPNITKILLKNQYLKEEISEKIRLLYVALTRAKEKMILITENKEEEMSELQEIVDQKIRYSYQSFLDIMKSLWGKLNPYKKEIDIESLFLTKDYNKIKKSNYKDSIKKVKEVLVYQDLEIEEKKVENTSFSKKMTELITPENYESIEMGKKFHYLLETLDFLHPNFTGMNEFEKSLMEAFLKQDIISSLDSSKVYKEYEFMDQTEQGNTHGIIDCMIEKEDTIQIIDYKLKHIVDSAYLKQLKGYQNYISSKTNKEVSIYLYSILDKKLEKLG